MKIKDYYKFRNKIEGDVGIEIEFDSFLGYAEYNTNTWSIHSDGSLSENGCEFVLNKPIKFTSVRPIVEELYESFEKANITPGVRAGIHIHINVRELTPVQLVNYICAYISLEEIIFNWFDKSRKGNHFCLRASDSGHLLEQIYNAVKTDDTYIFREENTDIRYAGVNLTSIPKYGSIEFRGMESTLSYEKLIVWVRALENILTYSLEYKDPVKMFSSISEYEFDSFARNALGDVYKQFSYEKNWLKDLKTGIRNAQDIAFSRKWGEEEIINIFKEFNKKGQGRFFS